MAEEQERRQLSTERLYSLCIAAVVDKFDIYGKDLEYLPDNVLFDVYYQLYKKNKLCLLGVEFSNLDTFSRMLRVTDRHIHLLQTFQALMDHGTGVGEELAIRYILCCNMRCTAINKNPAALEKIISLGLRLGGFLNDAGWFSESEQVLLACKELCVWDNDTPEKWCRTLVCCQKLLHAQSRYYSLQGADKTHRLALDMILRTREAGYEDSHHAALYAEFSVLFFVRSEYDKAYIYAIEAVKLLQSSLPAHITVDVLRHAAKACTMKREFQKAGLLIRQAVHLARKIYDTSHPKYSDVLTDYGFYLLNSDNIEDSVTIHKTALEIRKGIFGKKNLYVALSNEDLAYGLYVHKYSTGKFEEASAHIEKATLIMEKILPGDHLILASANRVKALIVEEVALSRLVPLSGRDLLLQSEALHLSALTLSRKAFGECNLQTAKHYGNLGRLYQSMNKFEKAEHMHLKAISIKEEVLGPYDFEVGLSIGHLASLYNFQMRRYEDAETLHHRSIQISSRLFGKTYSGLEYDYRGLLNIYLELGEHDKFVEYTNELHEWQLLRERRAESSDSTIHKQEDPQPIQDVINKFFCM